MNFNKKFAVGASTLVLGLTLVGGTLAWLTSEAVVTNKFSTKSWELDVEVEEEFKPEEGGNLLPGAEINKDAWVTNTKDLPVLIRVSVDEVWGYTRNLQDQLEKDDTLTEAAKTAKVAIIDTALEQSDLITNSEDDYKNNKWSKIGDYFYYVDVVKSGAKTEKVLDDVTINKELTTDQAQTFGGKLFDVIIKAQAIQIENDAYKDAWLKDVDPTDVEKVEELLDNAISHYKGAK